MRTGIGHTMGDDLRPGIEGEMLNHLRSGSREMRLAAAGVLAAKGLIECREMARVQREDFDIEKFCRDRLRSSTSAPVLRASEAPPEPTPPQPGLLQRLFARQSRADDDPAKD